MATALSNPAGVTLIPQHSSGRLPSPKRHSGASRSLMDHKGKKESNLRLLSPKHVATQYHTHCALRSRDGCHKVVGGASHPPGQKEGKRESLPAGVEATLRLTAVRSSQLSYGSGACDVRVASLAYVQWPTASSHTHA